MSDKFKTTLIGAAALAFLVPLTSVVQAAPSDQSSYSHALGDLRVAKAALKHQAGDPAASAQETAAVKEINKAIGELTQIVSGHGAKSEDMNVGEGASGEGPSTDIAVAPAAGNARPDVHPDQGSRMHNAQEALRKARADIDGGQADTATKAERGRITAHIDSALQQVGGN